MEIDLDELLGSNDEFQDQIDSIKQNKSKTVDFSYAALEMDQLEDLYEAITSNDCIETLLLCGNEIGDEGLEKLQEALKNNKTLETVDLSFNNISSTTNLFELIKEHPTIGSVEFSGNDASSVECDKQIQKLLAGGKESPKESKPDREKRKKKKKKKRNTIHSEKGIINSNNENGRDSSKKKVRKTVSSGPSGSSIKSKKKSKSSSSSKSNSNIKILEKRIQELEQSEAHLVERIRELELTSAPASSGLMSYLKSPKPSNQPKKMTISLKNIFVAEKLAEIGGSNCGVYSVFVDGWQCAMKELLIEDENEYTLQKFEEEIRLLELLPPHKNIVRYLFHEKVDNKLRLFMTKYSGSLANVIQKRRQKMEDTLINPNAWLFDVTTITRFMLDIIKGLCFLHDHHIIHRDLKSDNVFAMLNDRKEVQYLAIADFDTAKKLDKKTIAKTCIGTPAYMAPEVMNATFTGEYTFKVDIYSTGLILYELLTLKMPYEDVHPFKISQLVVNGTKPEMPEFVSSDPRYVDLLKVYYMCVDSEPENRPTVHELKTLFIDLI